MARGGLDGVLVPFRIADVAFLDPLPPVLFFSIASLFTSPFPSVSLVLLNLFFDLRLRGNDIFWIYKIEVGKST